MFETEDAARPDRWTRDLHMRFAENSRRSAVRRCRSKRLQHRCQKGSNAPENPKLYIVQCRGHHEFRLVGVAPAAH
jgi:hypothetical protein